MSLKPKHSGDAPFAFDVDADRFGDSGSQAADKLAGFAAVSCGACTLLLLIACRFAADAIHASPRCMTAQS